MIRDDQSCVRGAAKLNCHTFYDVSRNAWQRPGLFHARGSAPPLHSLLQEFEKISVCSGLCQTLRIYCLIKNRLLRKNNNVVMLSCQSLGVNKAIKQAQTKEGVPDHNAHTQVRMHTIRWGNQYLQLDHNNLLRSGLILVSRSSRGTKTGKGYVRVVEHSVMWKETAASKIFFYQGLTTCTEVDKSWTIMSSTYNHLRQGREKYKSDLGTLIRAEVE